MRLWVLLGILIMMWPAPLTAQTTDSADPDSEYKKTQDFINKTQSKIDQVRGETEARAKEIEALATRVADIISAMSSQGEDNTNLISEISVLNELLTIERQTTTGLRGDVNGLNTSLATRDAKHKAAQAALKKLHLEDMEAAAKREARLARDVVRAQDFTAAAQRNLSASEKKLGSALGAIAGHAKTNRVLASDVRSMRQEVRRLNDEILLIKRRRTKPLPRRPTPNAK
jgi:chromosome segregation ATPase